MLLYIKKLRYTAIILIASLSLIACDSDDNDETNTSSFSVSLSSENSIPQVTATGTGSATLTLDRDTGSLTGSVTVSDLTGDVTAAHIHKAIAGSTGGLVITLDVDNTNDQLSVPAGTVLSSTQISELDNSEYYFNVHTAANGSGEIRGQIVGANQEVIRTELNGDFQSPTPAVTSNTGVAYITVDKTTREIRGSVTTSAITNPGAGHIHNGFAGTIGGIEVTLTKDPDETVWYIPDSTILSAGQFDTLLAGGMYFNIHSGTFANGEVRGQITPENIKVTRDELDGSQSVPAVTTTATGIGYTTVNTDNGDITANVRTANIVATALHIHQAAAGNIGGLVIGLTQDGTDTDFWSATGSLSNDQLSAFSNSELYFNVHSDAHGDGEIRAQINP